MRLASVDVAELKGVEEGGHGRRGCAGKAAQHTQHRAAAPCSASMARRGRRCAQAVQSGLTQADARTDAADMLAYRHAFHAGNHADVLKHLVLVRVLRYMALKDKPCTLRRHPCRRGRLLARGPLRAASAPSTPRASARLLDARRPAAGRWPTTWTWCAQFNGGGALEQYPGSPAIAQPAAAAAGPAAPVRAASDRPPHPGRLPGHAAERAGHAGRRLRRAQAASCRRRRARGVRADRPELRDQDRLREGRRRAARGARRALPTAW